MNKITNEQNVENFEKRKILRIIIIITSIITIILAVASLILNFSLKEELLGNFVMLSALIFFLITAVLKRMRDKLQIEVSEKIKAIRREKAKKKEKNLKKAKKKQ